MKHRRDYFILSFFKTQEGNYDTKVFSLSAYDIMENLQKIEDPASQNTVNRALRSMEKAGLLGKGIKDGHRDTYFITEEGLKVLSE